MKAKLHQVQCNEGEPLEIPDSWIPVHLERNTFRFQGRKDYTLFLVERVP